MPLPVQLQAVVTEMEMATDEWKAYINRKTGELASFSLEVQRAADGEASALRLADWQEEQVEECKQVLADSECIALPGQHEIHEYSIMERFCLSLEDERASERLLDAIRGRGAFRRFKDMVHRQGIEDDWHAYRKAALKRIATDFLEAEGIAWIDEGAAT
jgi:hypothetical protein